MRRKSIITLLLVVLLVAAFGVMAFTGLKIGGKQIIKPVGESLSLGLDLRGGVYTVYYAEQDEYADAEFEYLLEGTAEVIRSRLTAQGYTEANVSLQGSNEIRVEIPDVTNPDEVLKLLGTPAHLTFTSPNGDVILEGKDIEEVGPYYSQDSAMYVVMFKLNETGTEAFSEATRRYKGQSIYIVLDDEVISAPVVNEQITGGSGSITLGSGLSMQESYEKAKELATLIMSGSLPLDIKESETRAISATLGEDAIDKAVLAGIVGIIAIFAFMVLIYRLPGLMADIALSIYIIIMFYALALLRIQLTLPGIAGILLGIGMAVDANVVIFERFREELINGKSYEGAVKAGFKNALRAIIDANITTLIAAFVLMYFGTGTIKGFSYTLCMGVVISMFTAVFVTRFLLKRAVRLGITDKSMYVRRMKANHRHIAYTKKLKLYLVLPAALLVIALVFNICGIGLNLGIDFTGGSLLEYSVNEDFSTEEVAEVLKNGGYADSQVSKVANESGEMTNVQIRLKLNETDDELDEIVTEEAEKFGLKLSERTELTSEYVNTNAWDTDLAGGIMFTFAPAENIDELKSNIETALAAKHINVSELIVEEFDTEAEQAGVRVIVVTDDGSSAVRELLETELKSKYPELTYVSIDHAGAVSSAQLIKNALLSLTIALALMLVYIMVRFDLYSGLAALLALAHDVLIMLAFMSFFGSVYQLNSSFIAAILTIVGYSINNTIIVFDRVRENKKAFANDKPFEEIAEMSISSTMARTLNTTITTLLTLLALYIFGVASIKEFAFPLVIGMFAGAYSSVLLAGPIWCRLIPKKRIAAVNTEIEP